MSDRASFNLIYEPWIPCLMPNGQLQEMGLLETLMRATDIREIYADSPLVTAAIYRLLLAILHRVYGPENRRAWGELWNADAFPEERLKEYFEQWEERFYLFHPERPFYQAKDERVKPKSMTSLVLELASGNNPTLFDHHTEETGMEISAGEAARILLVAQASGLAGLSGITQRFTDGTCARGVIILIEGDNLFETLMLNLCKYPDEKSLYFFPGKDMPAWEMEDPQKPERKKPFGILDYLTWQNRRIFIFQNSNGDEHTLSTMTVGPGLRLDSEITDPMKFYRKDKKKGNKVVRFYEERALWRDSVVLLNLKPDSDTEPPRSIKWLAELIYYEILDSKQIFRYLGFGMCNDQAKVYFSRQERMPLPLAYLQDQELVSGLGEALEEVDVAKQKLWGAVSTLAERYLVPDSDQEGARKPDRKDISDLISHWGAERYYWSELELAFQHLMIDLPSQGLKARETWRDAWRKAARNALLIASKYAGENSRGLKASVQAMSQLNINLAKMIPKLDQEGE